MNHDNRSTWRTAIPVPSPEEIRTLRGDLSIEEMATIAGATEAQWVAFETGMKRPQWAQWEMAMLKLGQHPMYHLIKKVDLR